jgi:alpha-amylase
VNKLLFLPSGKEQLVVRYAIENRGETRLQTRFACEWNIHLLGGGGNDQAYYHIPGHILDDPHFDSTGEVHQLNNFNIGNHWIQQDLGFSLSETAALWRFSIETVTGSEAGFERNHQGSCLALVWPLELEAGQTWNVEITCTGQKP